MGSLYDHYPWCIGVWVLPLLPRYQIWDFSGGHQYPPVLTSSGGHKITHILQVGGMNVLLGFFSFWKYSIWMKKYILLYLTCIFVINNYFELIGEHATIKHLDDLCRKKLINFYIVLWSKNTVLRIEEHLFLISMIQERKYLISHLFTTNTWIKGKRTFIANSKEVKISIKDVKLRLIFGS